jgi:hypothetical protein
VAEWVSCPHCRLKHARRESGVCPRCRRSIIDDSAPTSAAASAALPEVFDEAAFVRVRAAREMAESNAASSLSAAARTAGAIMLGNGVLQLCLVTQEPSSAAVLALLNPWAAGFDTVVGGVLLSGQAQVRRWAVVRLALGLCLLSMLHMVLGHWFAVLLQAAFSLGLLWLFLRGANGSWLNLVGVAGASGATLLSVLGVAPLFGVANPVGALSARLNGEIGREPVDAISGVRIGFSLVLPARRWYPAVAEERSGRRDDGEVQKEVSPLVRRPDLSADLQVYAVQVPAHARLDQDDVIDTLVEHERDEMAGFLVAEDTWLEAERGRVRVLEGQARMDGRALGVALGFAVRGRCVFMLAGTAPQRVFHRVRDELLQAFTSLDAPGCTS